MPPNSTAANDISVCVTFYVGLCLRDAGRMCTIGCECAGSERGSRAVYGKNRVTRFGRESMSEAGKPTGKVTNRQIELQLELIENSDIKQ
jgi:hypothetical protein